MVSKTTLNYIEHFLILVSAITGCVSISAFSSLVDIPIGYTSSAIGLKICAITAGNENHKSIIEKKKKRHDKMILLAQSKLNSIEVLISKTLIDSVISHDEFILINNALKKYNKIKEEPKNRKTYFGLSYAKFYERFLSIYKTIISYYCLNCRKNTKTINQKFARSKSRRIMLLSKCAVCDSKKLKFAKVQ